MDKVYDIKVMKLSTRIERVLWRHGIKTANDLFVHLSKDYLLKLRGLGQKSLDEIEKAIISLMSSDKELYIYLENLPRQK